jgi:hypothetical protein
MPILHVQIAGQTTSPDGMLVAIAPPVVLQERGPCVQVSINIARSIGEQLLAQGLALPSPETGMALFDTGASGTCIDRAVA